MQPFLERLARLLLDRHRDEMDRIAVVLPGRRAGLHLRKYLAQVNGNALWSPEVLDMGAFLQRTSGRGSHRLVQGGSLEMLFLLFEAHREVKGDIAGSFSEFLEWAPVALRDMSEVDAHLLDHTKLYRDLREYHELEEWSFRLGELSPGQERLNTQWRSTGDLHTVFARMMREKGVATSGFISRCSAEELTKDNAEVPWKMVWFAGLNALDPASTSVIRSLKERDLARIAWDADPYYLTDPRQEAGRYLRRSITDLGTGELVPQASIVGKERLVHSISAPNNIAQTTYAAQYVAGLTLAERSRTAVVLANEDLLLPLLQQLPPDIGPLNVTMGIPLKALPIHGLTEAFLEVHDTMRDNGELLLEAVEKLLGHPFLHEGSTTTRSIGSLRELRIVRVPLSTMLDHAGSSGSHHVKWIAAALAPLDQDLKELPDRTNALIAWAKANSGDDPSIREQLFRMAQLQRRLFKALDRSGIGAIDLRTHKVIRDRLLREERIDLLGEPLRGLQIMGVLETRALDHERLVVLSMNEGVLPASVALQSWIPFAIRSQHRLPMPADAEAISAYHFYRAMHMAEKVELVHHIGGGQEPGEPSRFLAQWKLELIGHSATKWTESTVASPGIVRRSPPVIVKKDAAVQQRLKALCERGLSPSAIGTWLRCPLDFYFKYILGIRDTEASDGTLGSDVLGEAVHNVLQTFFKPFVGRDLTAADVEAMIPKVGQELHDQLATRFSATVLSRGHFRLRREMAGHALRKYLEAEKRRVSTARTKVLAIEEEVTATLPNGVRLKGRVDRIDLRDGLCTVLDVKTGTVRPNDLRFIRIDRSNVGPGKRYALQLLIYMWAYMQQDPKINEVAAGVLPLQRPSQADGEFLKVEGSTSVKRDLMDPISDLLNELVNELLDPNTPFKHDPDSEYCTCCVP